MNNRATAQYTDAKATNTSLVSTSTPVDDMILPTYVPIDNLEVLKGAGKLGWGALQIVGSGFYNSGVRAIGGLGSIPYLLDGLDAAVAVQENFNADYSWQPQSEGANFIAEKALAPVGEKVGYGLQIARNYSEDYIGDTATSLIIGGVEFGLEAGGLLSGTAGIRRALTKAEPNANVLEETLEGGATNSTKLNSLEFAGGPQEFVSDLSHITGKGGEVRNRAIDAIIKEDFPDLNLTFTPEYNPFIGHGVAQKDVGTQIGRANFSSRADLRDVIIHEELHHRWWERGIFDHHPVNSPKEFKFYETIERYKRMRGWTE